MDDEDDAFVSCSYYSLRYLPSWSELSSGKITLADLLNGSFNSIHSIPGAVSDPAHLAAALPPPPTSDFPSMTSRLPFIKPTALDRLKGHRTSLNYVRGRVRQVRRQRDRTVSAAAVAAAIKPGANRGPGVTKDVSKGAGNEIRSQQLLPDEHPPKASTPACLNHTAAAVHWSSTNPLKSPHNLIRIHDDDDRAWPARSTTDLLTATATFPTPIPSPENKTSATHNQNTGFPPQLPTVHPTSFPQPPKLQKPSRAFTGSQPPPLLSSAPYTSAVPQHCTAEEGPSATKPQRDYGQADYGYLAPSTLRAAASSSHLSSMGRTHGEPPAVVVSQLQLQLQLPDGSAASPCRGAVTAARLRLGSGLSSSASAPSLSSGNPPGSTPMPRPHAVRSVELVPPPPPPPSVFVKRATRSATTGATGAKAAAARTSARSVGEAATYSIDMQAWESHLLEAPAFSLPSAATQSPIFSPNHQSGREGARQGAGALTPDEQQVRDADGRHDDPYVSSAKGVSSESPAQGSLLGRNKKAGELAAELLVEPAMGRGGEQEGPGPAEGRNISEPSRCSSSEADLSGLPPDPSQDPEPRAGDKVCGGQCGFETHRPDPCPPPSGQCRAHDGTVRDGREGAGSISMGGAATPEEFELAPARAPTAIAVVSSSSPSAAATRRSEPDLIVDDNEQDGISSPTKAAVVVSIISQSRSAPSLLRSAEAPSAAAAAAAAGENLVAQGGVLPVAKKSRGVRGGKKYRKAQRQRLSVSVNPESNDHLVKVFGSSQPSDDDDKDEDDLELGRSDDGGLPMPHPSQSLSSRGERGRANGAYKKQRVLDVASIAATTKARRAPVGGSRGVATAGLAADVDWPRNDGREDEEEEEEGETFHGDDDIGVEAIDGSSPIPVSVVPAVAAALFAVVGGVAAPAKVAMIEIGLYAEIKAFEKQLRKRRRAQMSGVLRHERKRRGRGEHDTEMEGGEEAEDSLLLYDRTPADEHLYGQCINRLAPGGGVLRNMPIDSEGAVDEDGGGGGGGGGLMTKTGFRPKFEFQEAVPCTFWRIGRCAKGSQCTFLHEGEPVTRTWVPCRFFALPGKSGGGGGHDDLDPAGPGSGFMSGRCRLGSACMFSHEPGLRAPCRAFVSTGTCAAGAACPLNHPVDLPPRDRDSLREYFAGLDPRGTGIAADSASARYIPWATPGGAATACMRGEGLTSSVHTGKSNRETVGGESYLRPAPRNPWILDLIPKELHLRPAALDSLRLLRTVGGGS